MSSDDSNISRPWVLIWNRDVLLHAQMENVLLRLCGCLTIFANMLGRHPMLDDAKGAHCSGAESDCSPSCSISVVCCSQTPSHFLSLCLKIGPYHLTVCLERKPRGSSQRRLPRQSRFFQGFQDITAIRHSTRLEARLYTQLCSNLCTTIQLAI